MKGKAISIVCISLLVAFGGLRIGFTSQQAVSAGVFCLSVLGILFFWDLRLSFVFFGTGILLLTHSVDLENLLKFASLDVILFLIGMMILVGMLNESGLIHYLIMRLLRVKNLTGRKLFVILMGISAVSSCLMGEVASMMIVAKLIIEISNFFDVDPIPLVIPAVLATNIGSSATVLGNPIGVLIAARGHLTFEDFLRNAMPVTIIVFAVTIIVLLWWYRKYIASLDEHLHAHGENTFFHRLISIPPDRKVKVSTAIFILTVIGISLHRRFELLFRLEENTLLLMLPILAAGVVLLYRREKVRHYIEHEVEWMSILFFLFLFAQAGVIKYSGISDVFAKMIVNNIGIGGTVLSGILIYSSGILSSILDNTVVVASYVPIVQSLGAFNVVLKPLWFAILFGACYGGNITAIGSTANIIALDIVEKEKHRKVSFVEWLKVGLVVGFLSMTCAYIVIIFFCSK